MMQTYSEVYQLRVPNVRLEINSEEGSEESGSDPSPCTDARAIKALKLEATISRSSGRRCTDATRAKTPCLFVQEDGGLAVCSGDVDTMQCTETDPNKCEMMTTV
jgi:hypothetical protein